MLACTTELGLGDKLDNPVNIVCVLHIVLVTKQASLAPSLPGGKENLPFLGLY